MWNSKPFCLTLALLTAFWLPMAQCCAAPLSALASQAAPLGESVAADSTPQVPHCHQPPADPPREAAPVSIGDCHGHTSRGDSEPADGACDCAMMSAGDCLTEAPSAVAVTSASEIVLPALFVTAPLPSSMLPHTFHLTRWTADDHPAPPPCADSLLALGCLLTT